MRNIFDLKYHKFSRLAILIQWPETIDEAILDDIVLCTAILKKTFGKLLVDSTPAYTSLLLSFVKEIEIDEIRNAIKNRASFPFSITQYNTWHIPCCYDDEFAPDIGNFTLNKEHLIDIHSSSTYRVFMIGFLPGFIYLGGLDPSLFLARKSTPSRKIFKGSVAIGGKQTGIYPMESPGGWHVIGRTPLAIFDIHRPVPIQIKQGDYLKFYPISMQEFLDWNPQ